MRAKGKYAVWTFSLENVKKKISERARAQKKQLKVFLSSQILALVFKVHIKSTSVSHL